MATTAPATPAAKATSSSAPIPSVAVQKFYDEEGRLIEAGKNYNYVPQEGRPYPWPTLRPQDEALAEELQKEYREYHSEKMQKINSKTSIRGAFESLARMQDD